LSVVSQAEKPSLREHIEFQAGAMIAILMMYTMLAFVGRTSFWKLADFYLVPHSAEIVSDVFFFSGILASGIWLLARHSRNKSAKA